MLRLTAELRKTTLAQARALRQLRLKTQKAAVHLQALLNGEGAMANGHTYQVLHVTWIVTNGKGTKTHTTGREVLAMRGDLNEVWTACYDPRDALREMEGTPWEVDYEVPALIEMESKGEVKLPTPATLMQFAKDYPDVVKDRAARAKTDLKQLQIALEGLTIQERPHAKS